MGFRTTWIVAVLVVISLALGQGLAQVPQATVDATIPGPSSRNVTLDPEGRANVTLALSVRITNITCAMPTPITFEATAPSVPDGYAVTFDRGAVVFQVPAGIHAASGPAGPFEAERGFSLIIEADQQVEAATLQIGYVFPGAEPGSCAPELPRATAHTNLTVLPPPVGHERDGAAQDEAPSEDEGRRVPFLPSPEYVMLLAAAAWACRRRKGGK